MPILGFYNPMFISYNTNFMKKIQSVLFSILFTSVFFLPLQSVFAVDVPLSKGDPIGPSQPTMLTRSVSTIQVSAALNNTELAIDFSRSVGVAQITIEDVTGAIVYQEVIDTNSTLQTVIETGGFDSGNYTLRITYGTTKLVGTFQL